MSREDQLIQYYGINTQLYGNAWPDLVKQLEAIYADKLSRVPWLPADWLDTIKLIDSYGGNVAVVVPSTASRIGGAGAEFLDTPEKKAWWDELAATVRSAITKYAAGKQAEGAKELQTLYGASAFWSRAYDWAVVLASPVRVVQGIWNNPYTVGYTVLGAVALLLAYKLISRSRGRGRR